MPTKNLLLELFVQKLYFESRERLGFSMAPREWVAQMGQMTKITKMAA